MARYGQQFGPDFTFLGVPMCDLDAPFDGGTSARSGARYGPMAIRMRDYLPHDGSRPSLALRTDGLVDLAVVDAGDVAMYSGDIETAAPEPGGLTARQLLDAVRRICLEMPVVGMDVVEVSPPYDQADITAALANRVVLEALCAIARKRRDESDGTTGDPARPLLADREPRL